MDNSELNAWGSGFLQGIGVMCFVQAIILSHISLYTDISQTVWGLVSVGMYLAGFCIFIALILRPFIE